MQLEVLEVERDSRMDSQKKSVNKEEDVPSSRVELIWSLFDRVLARIKSFYC